jgi:uncharacterized membrane protein
MKITLLLLLFFASSGAAYACTLCNSKTATAVRAAVFGPNLLYNLAITILPFIICSLIVYFIYHGGITKK